MTMSNETYIEFPNRAKVHLLVEDDGVARVFGYTLSNGQLEFRVAYWVPVLGVKESGFCDSYEQARKQLLRNDWTDTANAYLKAELAIWEREREELTTKLVAINHNIACARSHLER